ncbi:hypothetical protein [Catellatospora methionotrophica]|uniref:hypothetical protein n=1 Tax=Catellatospora methionotrophica TaxID=121620 RepID=UPI0033C3E7F5
MVDPHPSPDIVVVAQLARLMRGLGGGGWPVNRAWKALIDEETPGYFDWFEAAGVSMSNALTALEIAAQGLSIEQAKMRVSVDDRIGGGYVRGDDLVRDATVAVELHDSPRDRRLITVAIEGRRTWEMAAFNAGEVAPTLRRHDPTTLLQTEVLVRHLGALLAKMLRESEADGVDVHIALHQEARCAVCQTSMRYRARRVYIGPHYDRAVEVCSVTCARTAHAGESSA